MLLKRKIGVILVIFVLLLMVGAALFFSFAGYLATHYWWDRDHWNQERIAKAYISFYKDKARCPSDLADLVNAGYLPKKAEWYKEPPGFFSRPVDFKDSCYVVLSPESNNIEDLKIIGRSIQRDGKKEIDFSPPINAELRDALHSK